MAEPRFMDYYGMKVPLAALYDASVWLPVLCLLLIGLGMAIALLVASRLIAVQRPDYQKVSPYECGFDAFDDSRMKFDVRFYLVSLLFIIFDLEVAYLFPWAAALVDIGAAGFWSMVLFLGVLTVGFVYEWTQGALEWD